MDLMSLFSAQTACNYLEHIKLQIKVMLYSTPETTTSTSQQQVCQLLLLVRDFTLSFLIGHN